MPRGVNAPPGLYLVLGGLPRWGRGALSMMLATGYDSLGRRTIRVRRNLGELVSLSLTRYSAAGQTSGPNKIRRDNGSRTRASWRGLPSRVLARLLRHASLIPSLPPIRGERPLPLATNLLLWLAMAMNEIDLRAAVNAVSDVVQNRPRPLREFDQIYMKTADMVLQSEFVARWANGRRIAFIGDGDAISVCVAYLHTRGILSSGPTEIMVFDFDERICNAITRFADKERIEGLSACLYNVLDRFPGPTDFGCFYTNPPWGASNEGESVKIFVQRGMEATSYEGEGIVVVADDPELEWPKRVVANLQSAALASGFYVQRLMPQVHSYHLDDAPDLRSCNVLLRALPGNRRTATSEAIVEPARFVNFYGRDSVPRVRFIREKHRLDYGRAHEAEYEIELLQEKDA